MESNALINNNAQPIQNNLAMKEQMALVFLLSPLIKNLVQNSVELKNAVIIQKKQQKLALN